MMLREAETCCEQIRKSNMTMKNHHTTTRH
jgi:hypothetical protein